jgi:hypothetical protein
MKTWVRKSISVGVMAAGGLLATQAAAQADIITTGNFGTGNGVQTFAPIQTVTNVCGNATTVGGAAFAGCDGGAAAVNDLGGVNMISAGNFGTGNGLQAFAPIQTVTNVCGNATSAGGAAFAGCDGGALALNGGESGDHRHGHHNDGNGYYKKHSDAADEAVAMAEGKGKHKGKRRGGDWQDVAATMVSSGNYGLLNGTQVFAPIQTSINVCGISTSAGGVAFASCDGGAAAVNESARAEGGRHHGNAVARNGVLLFTGNNFGTGNGLQAFAPIQTVTNTCGLATSVGGAAFAACDGGAAAINESARTEGASREEVTLISAGNFGTGNGVQAFTPIQTVTNLCGVATSGAGAAFAACDGGAAAINESARAEGARDEALPVLGQLPVVGGLPVVGSLAGGGQNAAPAAPRPNTAPGARSGATEGDDYRNGKHHGKDDRRGRDFRGARNGGTTMISSGNFGTGNGVQAFAPIQTVTNVSGVATTVGGVAFAQSDGGALALN